LALEPYSVQRYRPELRNAVLNLQRRHWSPDASWNAEYFGWKYDQNPYMQDPCISLIFHRDELVGMRAAFGSRWRRGNEECTVPCAGDSVITPPHRGLGLFRHIIAGLELDVEERGFSSLLNLSAGAATYLLSLRGGWHCLGSFAMMQAEAGPQIGAHDWRSPMDLRQAGLFASFDSQIHKAKARWGSRLVADSKPRPREMAELARLTGAGDRIQHVRDEEYFNWRFRNPLSEYRFLYWGEGRLSGYLVLRVVLNRHNPGYYLADWEAEDLEVKRELLEAARLLACDAPMRVWSATLSPESLGLLGRAGFQTVPISSLSKRYEPGLLVKSLGRSAKSEEPEWLESDISNWALRMADSDGC